MLSKSVQQHAPRRALPIRAACKQAASARRELAACFQQALRASRLARAACRCSAHAWHSYASCGNSTATLSPSRSASAYVGMCQRCCVAHTAGVPRFARAMHCWPWCVPKQAISQYIGKARQRSDASARAPRERVPAPSNRMLSSPAVLAPVRVAACRRPRARVACRVAPLRACAAADDAVRSDCTCCDLLRADASVRAQASDREKIYIGKGRSVSDDPRKYPVRPDRPPAARICCAAARGGALQAPHGSWPSLSCIVAAHCERNLRIWWRVMTGARDDAGP